MYVFRRFTNRDNTDNRLYYNLQTIDFYFFEYFFFNFYGIITRANISSK